MISLSKAFALDKSNIPPNAPTVGPVIKEIDDKIKANEYLSDVDQSPFLISALGAISDENVKKALFADHAKFMSLYKASDDTSTDSFGKASFDAQSLNGDNNKALLYNIIHASKKKRLDADNISSYFAGKGIHGYKCNLIAKFVSDVRSRGIFGLVKEILITSKVFDTTVWSEYHNSLFSAVTLFNDFGKGMVTCGLITQEVLDRVLAINRFDEQNIKAIESDSLAKMQIYLTVTGNDKIADKWYQGKNAIKKLPPGVAISLRKLIKAYYAVDEAVAGKSKAEIKKKIMEL